MDVSKKADTYVLECLRADKFVPAETESNVNICYTLEGIFWADTHSLNISAISLWFCGGLELSYWVV